MKMCCRASALLYPISRLSSQEEHEALFVKKFIVPEKRGRWLEGLANKKKRNRFLVNLADHADLVSDNMSRITYGPESSERIYDLLLRYGAPETCWVISQWESIDGQLMSLRSALEKCLGIGLGTVVSCIPGNLCFYEAEMPSSRWVLIAK